MTQKDEPPIKEALDKAVTALKGGDLETGKAFLKWVLEREPNNVLAWLWMSRCAPNNEAKLDCFNRVLAIDPSNRHALEGVQRYGGGDKIHESPAGPLATSAAPAARVSAKQPRSVEMSEKPKRRLMNTELARVGWGFWLRWVLASSAGLSVGFAVGEAVAEAVEEAVGEAVSGASVGIAQWFILRRQVSRPGWWVLASTVGFALSGQVAGVLHGAITGGVLVWLLRQPGAKELGPSQAAE